MKKAREDQDSMEEKKELIESYDSLSIGDKRKELGREIAEMTAVTEKLLADINPDYPMKSMDDYINLFEENTSEDKYLTGLYEDIIELKEEIGTYYDQVTGLYYEDENSDIDDNSTLLNVSGFSKLGILILITTLLCIGIIVLGVYLIH